MMIFYFSGTGNSFQVASQIADRTHDQLVDIGSRYKRHEFGVNVRQGDDLGFVFPTYAWTTPKIVDEFLKKLRFAPDHGQAFKPAYCYVVLTCAAFVGSTARFFEKELMETQGIRLNASFSVQSVGTCVYLYSPAVGEKRTFQLEEARRETQEVAHRIIDDRWENKEERNPFGQFMSLFTCKDEKKRSIEPFHVLGTCVGCGLCETLCPTNTIKLVDGKPTWSGDDCTQCLGCLHRCPMEATQYGKSTEKRVRYVNSIYNEQMEAARQLAARLKTQREEQTAREAAKAEAGAVSLEKGEEEAPATSAEVESAASDNVAEQTSEAAAGAEAEAATTMEAETVATAIEADAATSMQDSPANDDSSEDASR